MIYGCTKENAPTIFVLRLFVALYDGPCITALNMELLLISVNGNEPRCRTKKWSMRLSISTDCGSCNHDGTDVLFL